MSKIKSLNNKLFDFDKSTSTFMHLMAKYRRQKKKIKSNDKMYIAKAIDKKRHELEIEEKDDMYIYREAKNTAHINQELINKYGKKAKTQSYDISKFETPIKLGKQKFFDPTKENYLKSNELKTIKEKGIIKLPLISEKYFNKNKRLLTYINSNMSRNTINRSNKYSKDTMLKNAGKDFSFESNKNINSESPKKTKNNESNIPTESNAYTSSFRNSKSDRNILITEVLKHNNSIIKKNKFREGRNNNLYCSNRNIFSYNGAYLTKLSNFKDQLIDEERKRRYYFNKNDYGCNLFKEKYEFLNKKYFE